MRTFLEIDADVAHAMNRTDSDALEKYADEMASLNNPEHESRILSLRGTIARFKGHIRESIEWNEKALEVSEAAGNQLRVATILGNMGNAYSDYGDLTKALECKHRALAIFMAHGSDTDCARVLVTIGSCYRQMDDTAGALEAYYKAVAYSENGVGIDCDKNTAMAYGNISNLFSTIDDYSNALEYAFRSIELFDKIGAIGDVGRLHGLIGKVHAAVGDATAAIERYQHAYDVAVIVQDGGNQCGWLEEIGALHHEQGNFSEALVFYRRALGVYEQLERAHPPISIQLDILNATRDLGDYEEAKRLMSLVDVTLINSAGSRERYWLAQSEFQVIEKDYTAARASLDNVLESAIKHSHRKQELEAYKGLRDLAQQDNDLAAYIKYNDAWQKVESDLRMRDVARRLTLQEKKLEIDKERLERDRERSILYSALPKHIADRVVRGEVINDHHDNASVIFLDIVGFTAISDRIPSGHVVHLLEQIFTTLDDVCEKHDVVKIKTIGDSYMAVSFESVENAAACALEMISSLDALEIAMPPSLGDTSWTTDIGDIQVRIGIHCGPVTAGVLGTQRMQYDVWGDTVNVASRMESTSEPGRIHVSDAIATALGESHVIPRGETDVKGKGMMHTFWLESTAPHL